MQNLPPVFFALDYAVFCRGNGILPVLNQPVAGWVLFEYARFDPEDIRRVKQLPLPIAINAMNMIARIMGQEFVRRDFDAGKSVGPFLGGGRGFCFRNAFIEFDKLRWNNGKPVTSPLARKPSEGDLPGRRKMLNRCAPRRVI